LGTVLVSPEEKRKRKGDSGKRKGDREEKRGREKGTA
jgi:hypothetical protein